MGAKLHRFPPQQEAFLRAFAKGGLPAANFAGAKSVSLKAKMRPVGSQGLQGTCVASAVAALLEHSGLCGGERLSVQFLHAATKELERAGLERNLANLREERELDAVFESVCRAELSQLRALAAANGGMGSAAVRPYLDKFASAAREHFESSEGCLLATCFRTVEETGVCRYVLWPTATAQAAPVFGGGAHHGAEFPPGTREDAAKRRVVYGLYRLATPNNAGEIRGILSGANGKAPMPVAVTVDFFEGCDGGEYRFPRTEEDAAGRLVAADAHMGRHAVLVTGYRDDAAQPGGGYFEVRNSYGPDWGRGGYGRMPYAYLECFAREAGTVLVDAADRGGAAAGGGAKRRNWAAANAAVALALAGATAAAVAHFGRGGGGAPDGGGERPSVPAEARAFAEAGEARPEAYNVFFSCENAAERRALRSAFADEAVPFGVEFLPPTLETVLAIRVRVRGGRVRELVAEALERHYRGPRREFWTDMGGLEKRRAIYMVRAGVRRWGGGL